MAVDLSPLVSFPSRGNSDTHLMSGLARLGDTDSPERARTENRVQEAFSKGVQELPSKPGLIEALKDLVQGFRYHVIDRFFGAYFGEKYKSDQHHSVQTLIDDAFAKVGLELKPLIERNDPKFKQIQKCLKCSWEGEAKRAEYYDWLDIDRRHGIVRTNVEETTQVVQKLKDDGIKQAFIMGMGGSSMGPKLIDSTFPEKNDVHLEIMDNMDPSTFDIKFSKLVPDKDVAKKTAFVITSKSGTTFEVSHVVQAIIDRLILLHGGYENPEARAEALKLFARNAVFITEAPEHEFGENKGTLNALAKELGEKTGGIKPKVIAHPPRIGGRFSLFSAVGMIASELKGLQTDKFIKGATQCVNDFFKANSISNCDAAKYALLDKAIALEGKIKARYVMPYGDELRSIPEFTAQLAGESNNKKGVASLNQISGRGPTAHHSDAEALNKEDLLFEDIILKDPGGRDIVHGDTGLESLKSTKLKSMHQDMLTNLALPLNNHLRNRKTSTPVISTILERKDEYSIGYLMMRYMLSTVIQAGLQGGDVAVKLKGAVEQKEVEDFKSSKAGDAKHFGLENLVLQAA